MNDIYKPCLWYYEKLMFLADHCLPGKSTAIGLTQHSMTEDNESEETCSICSQSVDIQPSPHQNIEGCYSLDVDVLNDVCIGEQCEEEEIKSNEIRMQLIRDLVNVTTETKLKDLQIQMQISS
ncbi:uncharacterized protein LOC126249370 [Schistocerca nitens]|uniref:uncharacterized protein LOC126249370 n=1 Tax=Schistocerca nitens TaxID=7011 RepID=UPI0021181356|nr:uncharacterized protein LOC126249370 [Schistocerca nitens]